jgi:hypothetical protein
MIKLTLFNPVEAKVVVFLAPYVLAPGRAFLAADDGEVGFTFRDRAELEAFRARLNAALDAAYE